MRRFFERLRSVFRWARAEEDLTREIQSHLALLEDEFRRRGMSAHDARLEARRAFNGVEQVGEHALTLNQGTLYPALVRLEQSGSIKGTWQTTENNREAKYYAITRTGLRALGKQTERWRRLAGLVDKLLLTS